MLTTAPRSTFAQGHRAGTYRAPSEISTRRLSELLQFAQRGPMWGARQLDIFRPEAVEPHDLELFCAGDLTLLKRPSVSIVGSRAASPHGLARAARLARELVEIGVVVVSGLAKGIDTSAHTSALDKGGHAIAVIGTPLSSVTPVENASLQETIWREHLLISPFPEGRKVSPSNFPIRNRVMAALSDATVIVEADDNSGTLHQAVACQWLGRWLFILKSVVETREWPRRFLHIKNTVILEETEQILSVLDLP